MANEEHLAKLVEEGVEAWNQWRIYNPDVKPNLSQTNLKGKNLSGADLREANLRSANLYKAYLVGAELNQANLRGTDFVEADLRLTECYLIDSYKTDFRKADLSFCNFTAAKLSKVDLSGANLFSVNFNEASLSGANLNYARLRGTIFSNTDLTEVQGLKSCQHDGPSTLDYRTLQRSGTLQLAFLRGCGLPEMLINYLPSLLNQSIQYYSCFISYSHQDEAFARRLHTDLQNQGVRCWYAPEDMKIGDRIRTRIDEVIHIHDKLLLILSEHSVASSWVEKEIETAFRKESQQNETVLFPIRLDNAVNNSQTGWANDILTRHIGDFSDWKNHDHYQSAFERLMRDLKLESPDE